MAREKSKPNRKKTAIISFRVLPEVAAYYSEGIAKSSLNAAEFYGAAIAGLVLNLNAFETGIEHGRMQAFNEIAAQLFKHKDHTERYARSLNRLFEEISGKGTK